MRPHKIAAEAPMLLALQQILDQPWKPISRPALLAWLLFYAGFLVYAFNAHGAGLFIDSVNLVVHEGGHNLFGWFGPTLGLWGGTLLQWLVPFLLAVYFFTQRQIPGFAFSLFFFFENWLPTATYMADARDQALPLVTTGDPDFVEHDFFKIFSSLGILNYDTKIALVVRVLGWCGMIGVTVWLAMRLRDKEEQPAADPLSALRAACQSKPVTFRPRRGQNRAQSNAQPASRKSAIENRKSEIATAPNPQ
jgi:hypothetical protein